MTPPPRYLVGTGHRPQKVHLAGRDAFDPAVLARLVQLARAALRDEQAKAAADGVAIAGVIAGGALGYDEALLVATLEEGLPAILALAFTGYRAKWPRATQDRYAAHEARVGAAGGEVVLVTDDATRGPLPLPHWRAAQLLDTRNRWMVDAPRARGGAGRMLALWDGTSGGTANCLRYAHTQGLDVRNLWASWARHAACPPTP